MGGSAGQGQPTQLPAGTGQGHPMQGMPSRPGIGQGPRGQGANSGPLGEALGPLQDWRRQGLGAHQPGGLDKWQQWMERQRPNYGTNPSARGYRGGMGRRPITNAGSFSAAQTGQGGPGEEITAPAAVAGAPNSGQGGNAPNASPGGGPSQGPQSQDIINALRSRFGQR